MKALFSFIVLILLSSLTKSFSQDFSVPENYTLEAKEDYTKYEKDIIAAANWLKSVPLNEQKEKRKEVSAFVLNWVNGSPTVNVELNENLFDFDKKNPGMMIIYMASCAKFVLENNYSKDMRAKQKVALRDMIAVYKTGTGIKKDKKMEKLIKSDDAGEIDNWLAENLKVEGH
jgi:hypothetical protein